MVAQHRFGAKAYRGGTGRSARWEVLPFGSSSIDFEVSWWTGPTPLDQRRSRDEVVEKVKAALDNAGIEIPYPYRTLVFSKNEPDIIDAIAGRGTGNDAGK